MYCYFGKRECIFPTESILNAKKHVVVFCKSFSERVEQHV